MWVLTEEDPLETSVPEASLLSAAHPVQLRTNSEWKSGLHQTSHCIINCSPAHPWQVRHLQYEQGMVISFTTVCWANTASDSRHLEHHIRAINYHSLLCSGVLQVSLHLIQLLEGPQGEIHMQSLHVFFLAAGLTLQLGLNVSQRGPLPLLLLFDLHQEGNDLPLSSILCTQYERDRMGWSLGLKLGKETRRVSDLICHLPNRILIP